MEVSRQLQNRPLYVGETAASTNLMRGCGGFTADLDALENKKTLTPVRNRTTVLRMSNPYLNLHTD
jgi:hypothetical protein